MSKSRGGTGIEPEEKARTPALKPMGARGALTLSETRT
jgi:hypothetical protein